MTPDGTESLSTAQESNTRMEQHPTASHASEDISEGNPMTGQDADTCPAKKKLSEPNHISSSEQPDPQTGWCYIYLHNRRIEAFQSYINEKSPFQSFVLKAHPIKRDKSSKAASTGNGKDSVSQPPKQLIIGGIVFIQGTPEEIQRFFKEKSLFFTLVHDCATQRPAILPDETMRPLRQVVELASDRISFLPKPFAHYAEGHQLVRIIDGPLKGLEGCIMRINRDRKLVMQAGKLTLAIARAHREIFEPVLDTEAKPAHTSHNRRLTYLQEEVDKNLFFPQTQAEVTMYADNIALLADRALKLLESEKNERDAASNEPTPSFNGASPASCGASLSSNGKSAPRQELSSDILLFLLEEIAYHFDGLSTTHRFDLTPIRTASRELTATISQLSSPADSRLSASEKERLSERRDAITLGREWLFHG